MSTRPKYIPVACVVSSMPYRFVRARPITDQLPDLHDRLESDEIAGMNPFGEAMTRSLTDARFDPETGEAVSRRTTVRRRSPWSGAQSWTTTSQN